MPTYSIEELQVIGEKAQPIAPEFLWNSIRKATPEEQAAATSFGSGGRRRSSHHHTKRPVVMPKAAIPLALDEHHAFAHTNDSGKRADGEDGEDADEEIDDEVAARYYLRKQMAQAPQQEQQQNRDEHIVSLKYAAAVAATMHMDSSSAVEEEADGGDEDGWETVSRVPKKEESQELFYQMEALGHRLHIHLND